MAISTPPRPPGVEQQPPVIGSDAAAATAIAAGAPRGVAGIRDADFVRHCVHFLRWPNLQPGPEVSAFLRRARPPSPRDRNGSRQPSPRPARAGHVSPQAGQAAGSEASYPLGLGSTAYESRPPSHREKMRFGAVLSRLCGRLRRCAARMARRRITASSASSDRLSNGAPASAAWVRFGGNISAAARSTERQRAWAYCT